MWSDMENMIVSVAQSRMFYWIVFCVYHTKVWDVVLLMDDLHKCFNTNLSQFGVYCLSVSILRNGI